MKSLKFCLVNNLLLRPTVFNFKLTDPFVFVLGASGLGEIDLVQHVLESTNPNVRPVKAPSDAVNVTLDITFHGVIDMVSNILFSLGLDIIYFRETMLCSVRNQLCMKLRNKLDVRTTSCFQKILASCLHSWSSGGLHGQIHAANWSEQNYLKLNNYWYSIGCAFALSVNFQEFRVVVVHSLQRNISLVSLIFNRNMWDSHAGILLHVLRYQPCQRRPTINILSTFFRITKRWKTT